MTYFLTKWLEKTNITFQSKRNERKEDVMKEKVNVTGVPETMIQTLCEGKGIGEAKLQDSGYDGSRDRGETGL